MLKRVVALAFVLALSGPARADEEDGATPDGPRLLGFALDTDLSLEAGLGAFYHYLTLQENAAFAYGAVDFEPRATREHWRIRLPMQLAYRRAFVTPLHEATGSGYVEIRYKPTRRFRVELVGGARARYRPMWPDQYQPLPSGNLSHTHRYSRWSRRLGIEIGGMPIRHHHAVVGYRYEYIDYWADPNYDPFFAPTHLVPNDRTEHRLEGGWHVLAGPTRFGAECIATYRRYYFAFARDPGSGLTHAGAGGADPNPLARLWVIAPSVDFKADLADEHVTLRLGYTHEVVVDVYRGYWSYQGPRPKVGLRVRASSWLSFEAGAELVRRRYGPNSYQAIGAHPPLEDGTRRYDHRYLLSFTATARLHPHWWLELDLSWVNRNSNRPDYVPGVYPASRQYDINLDYRNGRAQLGLRYVL